MNLKTTLILSFSFHFVSDYACSTFVEKLIEKTIQEVNPLQASFWSNIGSHQNGTVNLEQQLILKNLISRVPTKTYNWMDIPNYVGFWHYEISSFKYHHKIATSLHIFMINENRKMGYQYMEGLLKIIRTSLLYLPKTKCLLLYYSDQLSITANRYLFKFAHSNGFAYYSR